jgi:hypothetical protein
MVAGSNRVSDMEGFAGQAIIGYLLLTGQCRLPGEALLQHSLKCG